MRVSPYSNTHVKGDPDVGFPRGSGTPQHFFQLLITRADDFGASPGTNDAILECLKVGFIRNVGVMAPAPYLQHRLTELIELQHDICLGIHATLTSEWAALRWGPVLSPNRVPSLVRADGTFHPSTASLREHGVIDEMRSEIQAQLIKLRSIGLRPSYLDCHMGLAGIAGLSEALADFCLREDLLFANAPAFRNVQFSILRNTADTLLGFVKAATNHSSMHAEKRAVSAFHPAKEDAISKLFCLDQNKSDDSVAKARHSEYLLLSDARAVRTLIQHGGICPATYLEPR